MRTTQDKGHVRRSPGSHTPDEPVDWAAVRNSYPALSGQTYLDSATKGIPAPTVRRAVQSYVDFVEACPGPSATEDTIKLIDELDATRRAVAMLIGACVDQIALVENTQHGLRIAADTLALRPGENVVLNDLEFLTTTIPWHAYSERGVQLRFARSVDGRISVDSLAALIDSRTRAVVVSSVQEANGFCIELATLSDVCRDRGVALVVDAAQHVGAAPLNVADTPVDYLAVGGHKWLSSPFGMGFLYVGEQQLNRTPPGRGYMSVVPPPEGWLAYLGDPTRKPTGPFEFINTAQKFEIGGTAPYVGAVALRASIEWMQAIGIGAITARVAELTEKAADKLVRIGATISPAMSAERAGIVSFRLPGVRDEALWRYLREHHISVGLRFISGQGGIRVSPHFYNDEADIDRLVAVAADAYTRSW